MHTSQEKFKFKLGIFVFIGFCLFVLAIFIIGKQRNLFDPVFRITTTFYNVSGLQVGNNVRFSGIDVGTVHKINIINDSTVKVEMMVKKSIQRFIKGDSEVGIGSEGIIGDRILIISQGGRNGVMVKNGQMLASTEPVETDAIIESLEITAFNAEIITDQLAEIVGNINSGRGTLGKLIKDKTIAEDLSKTMKNLKSSSEALDENMDAVQDNILLRGYFKRKATNDRKRRESIQK